MKNNYKFPDIEWFIKARFGMFIHFGLYAITARDMWYYSYEEISKQEYEKLFNRFNPIDYNPEQWAKICRAAGMKYSVLTTKHHDGFCLWDSKYTDFKISNTPYKKNILKRWLDAFRNEGIRVGLYYSMIDWHHPDFTVDYLHPQRVNMKKLNKNRNFQRYLDFMYNQIEELLTEYGIIDIFWADFSYGTDPASGFPGKSSADWKSEKLIKLIREWQPDILINNRLGIPGELDSDFATPEQIVPNFDITIEKNKIDQTFKLDPTLYARDKNVRVWESCMTLGTSWGYCRGEANIKNPGTVIRYLVECVSKNGNLLLNVGPMPRGRIQDEFIKCLNEVGKWLELNGESIYNCGSCSATLAIKEDPQISAIFTKCEKNIYLHFIDGYPTNNIFVENLGGEVGYIEFVNDGSDILFENRILQNKKVVKLNLPIIKPDPYNTVILIKLK